jgi:hypothetical protein
VALRSSPEKELTPVRELSDDELRGTELRLHDPYTQERLVRKIPPGAQLIDIVNVYVFERWPHEKVHCVECDGRRHKRGFTAELDTGDLVLLGSSCGGDKFGETWSLAEKRLRGRRRRQDLLFRLDVLLPQLPEIRTELFKWRVPAHSLDNSRRRFASNMRSLYYSLEAAARQHSGRLTLYERVRDRAAEEAAIKKKDYSPKHKWIEQEVHTIAGAAYFYDLGASRTVLSTLDLLAEIERLAGDTDGLETSKMQQYQRRLRDRTEQLADVLNMYRGSLVFFQPDNLRAVAAWATRTKPVVGSYVATGRRIQSEDGTVMELPPNYPPMEDTPLRILRGQADLLRETA